MKKLLLIISLNCLLTIGAIAQTHLGVEAGVDFARISYSAGGQTSHSDNITSFHAGIIVDHQLVNNIYLQPQLLIVGKGGKQVGSAGYETLNSYYLEVPINFLYKSDGVYGKFFGGLGPYFAMGIGGSYKSGGMSDKITFGADGYFKTADVGANFIIGYEFNSGLLFSANYSLGLSNIYPEGSRTTGREKNAYLGLSVGYLFGK